jgi:cobalt/nickel transport system permease protein
MQSHALDRYVPRDSLVHRLDPRVKLGIALLAILSNVALPDGAWLGFLSGWSILLLATLLARLDLLFTVRRSFVALPFALAAVSAIFVLPGAVLLAVKVGPWILAITDAGLVRFLTIVARSWVSVQIAILLVATTRFPDLMEALRWFRVPSILVAVLSLMYRYLAVLTDEAARLMRAREARSARPLHGGKLGGSLSWRARVAGSMAGQLFLRSYERSDRVYNAMVARGYRGELLTLQRRVLAGRDWAAGAVALAAIVVVHLVGRLPPR